jgi:predicted GIY-YIG superfamily endonuclease
MFAVYILENPKDAFYIGHTDNLGTRVASHNRTEDQREIYAKERSVNVGLVGRACQSLKRNASASAKLKNGNLRA